MGRAAWCFSLDSHIRTQRLKKPQDSTHCELNRCSLHAGAALLTRSHVKSAFSHVKYKQTLNIRTADQKMHLIFLIVVICKQACDMNILQCNIWMRLDSLLECLVVVASIHFIMVDDGVNVRPSDCSESSQKQKIQTYLLSHKISGPNVLLVAT